MRSGGLKRSGGLSGGGLKKTTKPINQNGRITQERRGRKVQWEKDHPPMQLANGVKYYFCHVCLYFGEPDNIAFVRYERYVLEHIVPKGRLSLEESQEDSNLGPSHIDCNNEKGSMELWQMQKSPKSGLPNPHPYPA